VSTFGAAAKEEIMSYFVPPYDTVVLTVKFWNYGSNIHCTKPCTLLTIQKLGKEGYLARTCENFGYSGN
jgi:hypothetical protein